MTPNPKGRRVGVALALLAIYFIWGSTYLAIRFAIETLPPFLMASTRFLVAGGILLLWAHLRGRGEQEPLGRKTATATSRISVSKAGAWRLGVWKTRGREAGTSKANLWKASALSGLLMFTGGNGTVVWAEQFVPSGMVALLIATVPLWIVLQDWLSGRGPRPAPGLIIGILWGFFGVGLLVTGSEIGMAGPEDLLGGILVVFGAFCWSAGSLVARYGRHPRSAARGNGVQMIAGGAGLLLLALLAGEPAAFRPGNASASSLLALAYLVVVGSIIAFSCYIWLLRNTTPAVASTYAYINPAVALFLGWALASEPLSPRTGLAAFIILSAVLVITTRRTGGAPSRG